MSTTKSDLNNKFNIEALQENATMAASPAMSVSTNSNSEDKGNLDLSNNDKSELLYEVDWTTFNYADAPLLDSNELSNSLNQSANNSQSDNELQPNANQEKLTQDISMPFSAELPDPVIINSPQPEIPNDINVNSNTENGFNIEKFKEGLPTLGQEAYLAADSFRATIKVNHSLANIDGNFRFLISCEGEKWLEPFDISVSALKKERNSMSFSFAYCMVIDKEGAISFYDAKWWDKSLESAVTLLPESLFLEALEIYQDFPSLIKIAETFKKNSNNTTDKIILLDSAAIKNDTSKKSSNFSSNYSSDDDSESESESENEEEDKSGNNSDNENSNNDTDQSFRDHLSQLQLTHIQPMLSNYPISGNSLMASLQQQQQRYGTFFAAPSQKSQADNSSNESSNNLSSVSQKAIESVVKDETDLTSPSSSDFSPP